MQHLRELHVQRNQIQLQEAGECQNAFEIYTEAFSAMICSGDM